ncbi:phosphate ABC transporter substrate-binding protein PstS [Nocardioides sp. TRM66260-LWL]|uniref:phosphate ABC transporter substrate-binding protein PstS n=1 Tax=Nocardioides sp. TRM66260-LWL TaxID=2874478 RepID=UPI001CC6292E|nr:phosphate ABC transporter substrate-binding protein PstS [Nocardioides sp. TRM66260-LWL]MBZ5734391.1 phosphate ABC transporter substrate-binding protein PstS [Nocardioides sp. TRM66260-LWL]
MTPPRRIRRILAAALALGAVGLTAPPATAPSFAADYVPISGAGSTWSQVAVDAWRADIRASGVVVNFAGTGSTDGRSQYIQGTVDFANTEIPFQDPPEPGQQAERPSRPYAYIPIVAGGTSFMYNLTVGGQRVRDLRLSAPTLAKIFTGQITRWNDPAIKADYGKALPDIPIIPVVRSDGAGASAQFSLYMINQTPSIYCPFIRDKLRLGGNACPSVSFYPAFGASKAQVGSNGVANYVSAPYGEGAIGYVEYAYAKRVDFPVASLLNKGGYYAQPTASNVAVALTRARVDPKTLVQDLRGVYNNPDKRAYPMSSYSYMVAPISTDAPFNAAKGRTLSTFVNYFLCAGQQKADILGYSPLPKNLVEAGFKQVRRIPGHVDPPSFSKCANPAFDILRNAPAPNPCDARGKVCTAGRTGGTGASGGAGAGGAGGGGQTVGAGAGGAAGGQAPASGTGGTTTAGGTAATGGGTGAGAAGVSGAPGAGGAAAAVDPLTGAPAAAGTALAAGAPATAVEVGGQRSGQTAVAAWVVALMLLLTALAPPFLYRRLRP